MIMQPYNVYIERKDKVGNKARFYAMSIEPIVREKYARGYKPKLATGPLIAPARSQSAPMTGQRTGCDFSWSVGPSPRAFKAAVSQGVVGGTGPKKSST
jgi:hypothetical protein